MSKKVKETEYYDRLGVPPDANAAQIKKGYRNMAMRYHPDKNDGDPDAAEKFKEVSEAYEILSDEDKRSAYDRYGKDAFKDGGSSGMSAEDIFASFFGGNPFSPFGSGFTRRERGPKKTKDMVVELGVSLEDLYNGTVKKMKVTKNVVCKGCAGTGSASQKSFTCSTCHGSGVQTIIRQFGPGMIAKQQIRCEDCGGEGEAIPYKDRCKSCQGQKVREEKKVLDIEIDKGMADGKKIVRRGEASEAPGCVPGDLIFIVKEQPHKDFQRDGVHLFMEKEVPLVNALTGFQFSITHLDGRKILVKTKQGDIIKTNDAREIGNEGMPVLSRPYEHGNLYIKFKVKFPTKLSDKAITTLRNCLPDHIPPPRDTTDMDTAVLSEVDENNLKQDSYKTHNAYDESDDDGHHGGGVQCAQQ